MKSALMFVCLLLCSFARPSHPFDYDLHLTQIPGKSSKTLICFHGMGGDYQIAAVIQSYGFTEASLISFNFPDHGLRERAPEKMSFGSIQELLPALYVLKQTIVDEGRQEVSLYGFSAGGGAVINTLAVLNSSTYDSELKQMGIGAAEKKKILDMLQRGVILLDAPLKSMEEIIAFRGSSEEFEMIAARYRGNRMNPIDSLERLNNLALHIVLCFPNPDEILSNRDDELFINRLKEVNARGTTRIVQGEEGHMFPHPGLWEGINF